MWCPPDLDAVCLPSLGQMFLTDKRRKTIVKVGEKILRTVSFLVFNVVNLQFDFTERAALVSHKDHRRNVSKAVAKGGNLSTPLVR